MEHLPDAITITLSQIETLKSGISTKSKQLLAKTSPVTVPTISSSCAIAYEEILTDVLSSMQIYLESFSYLTRPMQLGIVKTLNNFEESSRIPSPPSNLNLQKLQDLPMTSHPNFLQNHWKWKRVLPPLFRVDYLVFKHSWTAVADVYWDDANQVEQIKQIKVDVKTRRIIAQCDIDYYIPSV